MLSLLRSKRIVLLVLLAGIVFTGLGCKGGDQQAQKALEKKVVLNYWRVFDNQDAFDAIINDYRKLHPNVEIRYKKLRFEEYESELLNALAEDRGPDVFSIHNTWVTKYQGKILPMPSKITLPYVTVSGGALKQEKTVALRDVMSPTIQELKGTFANVVLDDVVREGRALGLPLSVDTLALLYNRDMLNQSGIPEPPRTWAEVKEASKRITLQDAKGEIVRSGIALGGTANINRAPDIMALLMMQNGAELTDASGRRATFAQVPNYIQDSSYRPGQEAVRFYSDFANPQKEVYTWNASSPESLYAFLQWKTAMLLTYSHQIPLIRAQAPKLDFGIAPVPHITPERLDAVGREINFANYWIETVSKKTANPNEAWDFLLFATSKEHVTSYLQKTKQPTALRALVNEQLSDPDVGVFASQLLTARSWYHGREPSLVEQYFRDMVDAVLAGKRTIEDAIKIAEQKVNQTY